MHGGGRGDRRALRIIIGRGEEGCAREEEVKASRLLIIIGIIIWSRSRKDEVTGLILTNSVAKLVIKRVDNKKHPCKGR